MTTLPVAALVAAALAAPAAFAQPKQPKQPFESPGSTVAGKTIGEWTADWWTWLVTTPLNRDPALDETGAHCGIGQDGPVWFLAGAYDERPVARRCKVPADKYILFPMYTGLIKPTPEQPEATCDTSRDKAARFAEAALGLQASIDGVPVAGPERFRERTTACFDPDGTGRVISAQDGYWIMLRPLPPGKHVLRFGRNETGGRQNTDVSLVLQVGQEASPRVVARTPQEIPAFPHLIEQQRRTPSAPGKKGAAVEPASEDFPRYSTTLLRPRPGFGLRDFQQRLVALILREGKYRYVASRRRPVSGVSHIEFTWPDVKARYAASEDLRLRMPHSMTIPMIRNEDGTIRIDVAGVDPNAGQSFSLRAEIVADAARMVAEALDRRAPVTDEERLRAIRYRPQDFFALAGGDPADALRAHLAKKNEQAMDRAAASRPASEQDKRQFTAGEFSAAGAEVHAIGVYRGPQRGGSPRAPSRITVRVGSFTARPIVLLLTAYEPVEWHVFGGSARVSKIIALGYQRQTIASAPANTERVSRSHEDGYPGWFYSFGKDAEDLKKFFDRAKALTGELPASFQGRYSASEFYVDGEGPVRIEGKRASSPVPSQPPRVVGAPGDVRFEAQASAGTLSPDGLGVTSCLSDSAIAMRTNRSHIRGKVYFELTLKLRTGALQPGVNIGLVPVSASIPLLSPREDESPQGGIGVLGWSEVMGYRDGDVFGIAADLDGGRLFFHVNGDWKGSAPGTGGTPIAVGRAYAAAASIGTSSARASTDCNGWTGNFGKTPFKYALPQGYKSYDGTR